MADMQKLGVVKRLFPLILSGEKRSTIRWREVEISSGYMRYINESTPSESVVVWVTQCTDMPLSKAAAFLGKESEWTDTIMLDGMREHYPKIKLSDIVQVIEHLSPDQTCQKMEN